MASVPTSSLACVRLAALAALGVGGLHAGLTHAAEHRPRDRLALGATPLDRLRAIFPVLEQWFRRKQFYGCPFINAVAEHAKSSDRLRKLAIGHKQQVLHFIRQLCVEAGLADAEGTTHEIAILIDGAIVAAMITKDPTVAGIAQRTLEARLASQLGLRDLASTQA